MKEPNKKDSEKKKPSSFPIPSAGSSGRDDKTEFDIPAADAAPKTPKKALNITPSKKSKAQDLDETNVDLPTSDYSQQDLNETAFDIQTSSVPELNNNATSIDIDSSKIPALNNNDTSIEIDSSKVPGLNRNDTSIEINKSDIPGLQEKKSDKKKKPSMEDTDGLDSDEVKMAISTNEQEQALKYSYHASEESENKGASIFDLLEKNELTESDIEESDPEAQLSETLSGKSLDEILKTSQKKDEEYHESQKESISERKEQKKNKKQKKIILASAICLIVISAIIAGVLLVPFNSPPEVNNTVRRVPIEKLQIPANLKDEKKLNSFLTKALNLYNSKQYSKSESILKKLIKTGWNTGLINGILGNCRYEQKDESGAIEYYKASIKAGYRDKIEYAMKLGEIYDKQKNYKEVLSALEPFKEKFASNQDMHQLLSVAYYSEGKMDEAVECYRKINPILIPEKQLQEYAALLLKRGEKQNAFEIYLTLGKVYDNINAYIKAEELAPDEKTKMSILAEIVANLANTPRGVYYKMKLGIRMFNSGQRTKGLQMLKGVNAEKLTKKDAAEYLEMLPHFEGDKFLIQEALSVLLKYYSDDVKMHERLKEILIKNGKNKFSFTFFKDEYLRNKKNPVTNYIYASFQSDPKNKIAFYKNSIKLSPNFYEGNLALGKLYINTQNWQEAAVLLKKCERLRPDDQEAKFYSTLAKIKITGQVSALRYFENYLTRKKIPKDQVLKQMVLLSQYMKNGTYPLIYLKQAESMPSLKEFCKRESIKIKLIYGGIKKSDFTDLDDPIIKKYYAIYLLSKGEYRTIISIPTKKEDYPDFWKVFVWWKRNIPSWENNAHLLLKRNPDDILITTAAKMWLGEIKPETAAKYLDRIDYIDRPLLCIIIAEQYKKNMNSLKSSNFFTTALTYSNPNIYVKTAKYLKQSK